MRPPPLLPPLHAAAKRTRGPPPSYLPPTPQLLRLALFSACELTLFGRRQSLLPLCLYWGDGDDFWVSVRDKRVALRHLLLCCIAPPICRAGGNLVSGGRDKTSRKSQIFRWPSRRDLLTPTGSEQAARRSRRRSQGLGNGQRQRQASTKKERGRSRRWPTMLRLRTAQCGELGWFYELE